MLSEHDQSPKPKQLIYMYIKWPQEYTFRKQYFNATLLVCLFVVVVVVVVVLVCFYVGGRG